MTSHLKDIQGSDGSQLAGKHIALGISGSVAALESPRLARLLMRHGAEVHAVLSPSATEMISPQALEWATGNPPVVRLTGRSEHLELCGRDGLCSLLLVAPATANTIGKMALGLDDTPLTTVATTALGAGIPVLVAPGMHEPMYAHPAVQENLRRLDQMGVQVIAPLVSEGKAKMATAETILEAVLARMQPQVLQGKKVLLTGGPTREPLDEVRVITNPSSGRMAVELAREAARRGAEVCLVYGPAPVPPPPGIRVVRVTTSAQMAQAVQDECRKTPYDAFLAVAAVADYAPEPRTGKIPTQDGLLEVKLLPTPKILDTVRDLLPHARIVGFKAQNDDLLPAARSRLAKARADLMVANRASAFESEDNEIWLVTAEREVRHQGTKARLAAVIWEAIWA